MMYRDDDGSTEQHLREVADTLSRTGRVLGQGLEQANIRGQNLKAAIARLERSSEWTSAERKRGEEEIRSFFDDIREIISAKENELLRDVKSVYDVQDEGTRNRLEELVQSGQKLSKACQAIQGIHDGTVKASIDSLNPPLNQLLEALESSYLTLQNEEALQQSENSLSEEEKGAKFTLCVDRSLHEDISNLVLVRVDATTPSRIFVGSRDVINSELSRLNVSGSEAPMRNSRRSLNGGSRSSTPSGSPRKSQQQLHRSMPVERSPKPMSATKHGSPVYRESRSKLFPGDREYLSPGSKSATMDNNIDVKVVLPYDGDNQGVVFYCGTKGGSDDQFSNPALFSPDDPFLMVLRASSRIEGDLASLVGFSHEDGTFFETDSQLSSWVSVEFPWPIAPTHYTLGYYINGQDHFPRNWVLQGSNNNSSWTTLKVHENDMSLENEAHMATWKISDHSLHQGPYRFFRIMQTGPSSTGTLFLVLSFIEFYGTVFSNNAS